MLQRIRNPLAAIGIPGLFFVLSMWIFFRVHIDLHFQYAFSDRADGLIEVTHLEHWNNVFDGISPWNRTLYFHPNPDTIGYNDGYLIFGIFHAVFRHLGLNPFISGQLVDITLKAIGFAAFYAGARHVFGTRRLVAGASAAAFTLWSSSYGNAYHEQLFALAFAPVLTLLGFRLYAAMRAGARSAYAYAVLTAALIGAWALTAFYMLWFDAYFLFFCALIAGMAFIARHKTARRWLAASIRPAPLAVFVVALGLCLLPFWSVYHYTSTQTGGHPFAEVTSFLPSMFGIINPGPTNISYGFTTGLIARHFPALLPRDGEQLMGVPFLTFLIFNLLALLHIARHGLRNTVAIAWLAVWASWLVTVNWGGHTLWGVFYEYFPAAKAVRVISRYELFLAYPICVVTMLSADALFTRHRRLGARLGLAALLAVTIGEQFNRCFPYGQQPALQMAWLHAIPAPPAGCASFYAVHSRNDEMLYEPTMDSSYGNNVDAMFIAEMIHLPTLNGMDSFVPTGWNLVGYRTPAYHQRVDDYISRNHLHDVCALDLLNDRWQH